jgi:Response regulator receiver domain
MDVEMPVVDGWEATRRLKGDPQTRDIPIIALSAHALAGEREKALGAGCNEFDTSRLNLIGWSQPFGAFLPTGNDTFQNTRGKSQSSGRRVFGTVSA